MAAKKILLVEGPDDEYVLKHICGNRGLPRLDDVKAHGGVDQLLDTFPVRLKASEYGDIVGVVIDADTDLRLRWQSLRDRLIRWGTRLCQTTQRPTAPFLTRPLGFCCLAWASGSCPTTRPRESWRISSAFLCLPGRTVDPRPIQCGGYPGGRATLQSAR